MIKRIVEKAKIENKKIYLFVHKKADNDALNSATVLLQYFLEQGIETKFVYLDSNASIKRFSLLKEYKIKEVDENNISVILDTSSINMLDIDLYNKSKKEDIYVIDHHMDNGKNLEDELELNKENYIRNDKETSCAEVLLNNLDKIPENVIKNILSGLLADTGKLKNIEKNTYNNLLKLINMGISYDDIQDTNKFKLNINILIGISKLLEKIEFINVGNTYITILKASEKDMNNLICNYNFKPSIKLINFFNQIDNCPLFVFLEEKKDKYEVSLRSNNFYGNINVAELAVDYNGGGHQNAAGMSIRKEQLELFLNDLQTRYDNLIINPVELQDVDYKLLNILKENNYLNNVSSNEDYLKILGLINNEANYNFLINRFIPLNLFLLKNEIISNIPKDSNEINLYFSKEECDYFCNKYFCTLDDILNIIDDLEVTNVNYINIKLYNGKTRCIDNSKKYKDNNEKELIKNI